MARNSDWGHLRAALEPKPELFRFGQNMRKRPGRNELYGV